MFATNANVKYAGQVFNSVNRKGTINMTFDIDFKIRAAQIIREPSQYLIHSFRQDASKEKHVTRGINK